MVNCENMKKNISKYGDEVHSFDDGVASVASTSTDKAVKLDKAERDSNSIDGSEMNS